MVREGLQAIRKLRDDEIVGRAIAANVLQLSTSAVTYHVKLGRIPATKTLGGHYRYRMGDLRKIAIEMGVDPELIKYNGTGE